MCFASVRHVVTPPAFINQQSSYPMKHHTSLSKMHRGFAVVSLALLGVALSGCSGEPSAGDIDKTVRNYMSKPGPDTEFYRRKKQSRRDPRRQEAGMQI